MDGGYLKVHYIIRSHSVYVWDFSYLRKQDTGFYMFTFRNYGLWKITASSFRRFWNSTDPKPSIEIVWGRQRPPLSRGGMDAGLMATARLCWGLDGKSYGSSLVSDRERSRVPAWMENSSLPPLWYVPLASPHWEGWMPPPPLLLPPEYVKIKCIVPHHSTARYNRILWLYSEILFIALKFFLGIFYPIKWVSRMISLHEEYVSTSLISTK